ncbi:MAG: hypothetical protein JSR77_17900 [Planctomycetes bacterium]|nr:hypothetical protein [Planctomycetota bacterium]
MAGTNLTNFLNQMRANINDLCDPETGPEDEPDGTAYTWLRADADAQPSEMNDWAGKRVDDATYPSPQSSWNAKVGDNAIAWWGAFNANLTAFANASRPSSPASESELWDWGNDSPNQPVQPGTGTLPRIKLRFPVISGS